MKKIGGNEIFGLLREYRFLWIEGRVGGGKTSFAVELAEFYAEKGYRVVAAIGQGGMSELYRVADVRRGFEEAALKLVRCEWGCVLE